MAVFCKNACSRVVEVFKKVSESGSFWVESGWSYTVVTVPSPEGVITLESAMVILQVNHRISSMVILQMIHRFWYGEHFEYRHDLDEIVHLCMACWVRLVENSLLIMNHLRWSLLPFKLHNNEKCSSWIYSSTHSFSPKFPLSFHPSYFANTTELSFCWEFVYPGKKFFIDKPEPPPPVEIHRKHSSHIHVKPEIPHRRASTAPAPAPAPAAGKLVNAAVQVDSGTAPGAEALPTLAAPQVAKSNQWMDVGKRLLRTREAIVAAAATAVPEPPPPPPEEEPAPA